MKRTNEIGNYLDSLFPNPKCELIYHNDYELLIAIVLSAQTTDKRVNTVTPVLFHRYPSLYDLKNASIDELENILRPIGSFHIKAKYVKSIATILNEKFHDSVPRDRDLLISLPGVGRKTCNVFLSEFYKEAAIAVDTHVDRVSKRLGIAKVSDDVLLVEEKLMKTFPKEEWGRRHLQLVLFGRYYCKAVKPQCADCLLISLCHEKNKNIPSI